MKISPDLTILVIVILLVGTGIAMIYSASAITPVTEKHRDPYMFLKRQLRWVGLGVLMMLAFMYMDYRILQKLIYPLFFLVIGLLLLVFVPGFGRVAGGSRRWLRIGPVAFQPSELAKYTLIIYLASSLSRKQNKLGGFNSGVLPYLFIMVPILLLVVRQPDMGTAILLGLIFIVMLFLAGGRLFHLAGLTLCSLPFIYLLIYKVGYRKARILAFLNPWEDPLGKGYHTIQSLLALGTGGIGGLGLGGSRQKLFYLFAPHTDFIFSIIGEELGFIGTTIIALLFIVFLWQGSKIALEARDPFGYLAASGITLLIVFQAFLNMGIACGILPVTGLPLPFVSYGGSSLVFTMAGVGVLLSIWRHRKKNIKRRA